MPTQNWTFETSPIAWEFKRSRAFCSIIIGPVGSGKSVPLLQRPLDHGSEQIHSSDGKRHSRFVVIRNTMPELRATTAVTYGQIFPEEGFGPIVWRSPATAYIRPRGSDLDVEINFIALDKPKDVKKLLSLEITGAAINEIREVPRSIVTRLTERVGRFALSGAFARPTSWSGIWGDTQPPDADHWLFDWHHVNRPEGFEFYQQPPGVVEVIPRSGGAEIIDENFPAYQGIKLTAANCMVYHKGKVQMVQCPIEIIRAAERQWIVNPWHENMAALSRVNLAANPLGIQSYYGRALAGKTLEEIRCYLQGVYTFVNDGKRVVPQYHGSLHGMEHVPVLDDEPILIGADIGGGTLQPSALLFQKHPKGIYLAHKEVVCFDLGLERFAAELKAALVKYFPSHVERGLTGTGWGDPAGEGRDEIFETASFDYLRTKHGIDLRAAPSQDPRMRAAAIGAPCARNVDGKPGLMVNTVGCPMLHKGLMGAWHYKRVQVIGEDRFADKPSKNDVSHICDGAGYGFMGAGEFAMLGGRDKPRIGSTMADGDFDPYD